MEPASVGPRHGLLWYASAVRRHKKQQMASRSAAANLGRSLRANEVPGVPFVAVPHIQHDDSLAAHVLASACRRSACSGAACAAGRRRLVAVALAAA